MRRRITASVRDLHSAVDEKRRSILLRLLFKRIEIEEGRIVAFVLQPPFHLLLTEISPTGGSGGDLEDGQVRAAIDSILEHDITPLLELSDPAGAA